MKDFDQFFRKRLEGERPFSKRDENWRQLSRRLDAFDTGIQNKGKLTRHWPKMLWQAAAFTAAAATVWIGWQNHALRMENARLQEQISATTPAAPLNNAPAAPIPAPIPATPAQPDTTLASRGETTPADFFAQQGAGHSPGSSPSPVAARKPVFHQNTTNSISNQTLHSNQGALPSQQQTAVPLAQQTQQPEAPVSPTPGGTTDVATVPTPANASVPSDSAQSIAAAPTDPLDASSPKVPENALALLPTADLLHPLPVAQPKLPAGLLDAIPSMPSNPSPKIIRPVRSSARVRAGIQAVAGTSLPSEKGVSLLTGEGLLAEVRVFGGFWVGGSADWLRYDISAERNPPRFHLPEEPDIDDHGGPPQHHFELKQVETEQRQRRFSASLRYAVPTRGWLRPSVRVAHVWTQMPAAFVSYRLEEQWHGGPNPGNPETVYFTKKSGNQWFKNTWRVGAGLDVQLKNWSLGLSADYDKSFASNDPLFDTLLFRAGAVYQF